MQPAYFFNKTQYNPIHDKRITGCPVPQRRCGNTDNAAIPDSLGRKEVPYLAGEDGAFSQNIAARAQLRNAFFAIGVAAIKPDPAILHDTEPIRVVILPVKIISFFIVADRCRFQENVKAIIQMEMPKRNELS